jgi:hypothetical protein
MGISEKCDYFGASDGLVSVVENYNERNKNAAFGFCHSDHILVPLDLHD